MTFTPPAHQFAKSVLTTGHAPGQLKPSQPHHDPAILDTLFRNCSFCLERVSRLIDPILTAQSACQQSRFYLQGIMAADRAFLSTNLLAHRGIHVTLCATSWALGSSPRCAIPVNHASLSPCHAVLGYEPQQGFFLADVGSQHGTWVNQRRLREAQRRYLDDGDVIEFGSLKVEFLQEWALTDEEDLTDAWPPCL